ncbi:MAG: heavy-metal-associated domain-containing protein [Mucilaginibacter sp.]|nr:heavy-metal-associated domain-containing protein [Mucilaginibacter sp.]
MKTQKFNTNIKCTGCVSTVSPGLNEILGENNWKVDLSDPERKLTVEGDVGAEKVIAAIANAGYQASLRPE